LPVCHVRLFLALIEINYSKLESVSDMAHKWSGMDSELDKRQDIHNSDLPVLCRACEARHRGICGVLNPRQLIELSRHTTKSVVEADQEIAAAGQPVKRHANILKGVVKLSKLMADGRQQIVGLQFAPDFIGRPFAQQSGVTAEAATEVRVCSFPASALDALVRQSPELEHKLHQQALNELDEARDWMLTLGRKTAGEKVASFLYLIARNVDPEVGQESAAIRFEIPLKRADIADFLGLTIETVSRQITKLRHSGAINLINNRIVEVPDRGKLKRLSEQNFD
jgi:CRP/FNR family transcriptional regulator, anaerobic regulatory protein